jgi:hypothetical protein
MEQPGITGTSEAARRRSRTQGTYRVLIRGSRLNKHVAAGQGHRLCSQQHPPTIGQYQPAGIHLTTGAGIF